MRGVWGSVALVSSKARHVSAGRRAGGLLTQSLLNVRHAIFVAPAPHPLDKRDLVGGEKPLYNVARFRRHIFRHEWSRHAASLA